MPNPYIADYVAALESVVAAIPQHSLDQLVHLLLDVGKNGRQVFLLGNGGSAATASHMANDLNKLTITPGHPRFKAMALTDNVPLLTAWGNDNDFAEVFVQPLRHFLQPDDVVIGISTSGNSPNVVQALRYPQQLGATTVLFGGEQPGACGAYTDLCVLVPSTQQGIQEDCHLIFNHIVANTLRELLQHEVAYHNGTSRLGLSPLG